MPTMRTKRKKVSTVTILRPTPRKPVKAGKPIRVEKVSPATDTETGALQFNSAEEAREYVLKHRGWPEITRGGERYMFLTEDFRTGHLEYQGIGSPMSVDRAKVPIMRRGCMGSLGSDLHNFLSVIGEPRWLVSFNAQTGKAVADKDHNKLINWLLNDSPYADAFVTKDAKEVAERGHIIDFDAMPVPAMMAGNIAIRSMDVTSAKNILSIYKDIKNIAPMEVAYILGHVMGKSQGNLDFYFHGFGRYNTPCTWSEMSTVGVSNYVKHTPHTKTALTWQEFMKQCKKGDDAHYPRFATAWNAGARRQGDGFVIPFPNKSQGAVVAHTGGNYGSTLNALPGKTGPLIYAKLIMKEVEAVKS